MMPEETKGLEEQIAARKSLIGRLTDLAARRDVEEVVVQRVVDQLAEPYEWYDERSRLERDLARHERAITSLARITEHHAIADSELAGAFGDDTWLLTTYLGWSAERLAMAQGHRMQ